MASRVHGQKTLPRCSEREPQYASSKTNGASRANGRPRTFARVQTSAHAADARRHEGARASLER